MTLSVKEEPALVRDAFDYYYGLGVDRSYSKVALKFQKAVSTVEKWGKTYNWQNRVEERDTKKRKKANEQAIVEKELDYTQRNLKIIRRGILEHAKAIQEGQLKPSYKVLIDLIHMEHRLVTGTSGTLEVTHKMELSKMSNEEIENTINEKLEKLVGLKGIQDFKQLKDPIIDAEYSDGV